MRGKRFVEKVLDPGKKVIPFVALIRESRKKSGAEPLHSGKHFLPETAGSELLSCLVFAGTD
jgi:hypothetical protein